MRYNIWMVLVLTFQTWCGQAQAITEPTNRLSELQSKLADARQKKSEIDLADVYFLLAEYYENSEYNSEIALDYYLRSKQYYDKLNNFEKSGVINEYLADRYYRLGFWQEALTLYLNLVYEAEATGKKHRQTILNYKISKVYEAKGDNELRLRYLNLSISLNEEVKDTSVMVKLLLDKIKAYLVFNELDSALIVSKQSLDLAIEANLVQEASKALYYIGSINASDKDYTKAIKYLTKSLEMLPNEPYDEARRDLYQSLSNIMEATQQYEAALQYRKRYSDINDSILNHDRLSTINNLTIKHYTLEKDKEIEFLEIEKESVFRQFVMQRNAFYFVAVGFGLLLIALYYIIRFYTQRIRTETIINEQQHKIDQQKIKELEDTMQINNMQSMIVGQERERERIAKDLHDSLGGLLSTVKLQFDQLKTNLPSANIPNYDKAANLLDYAVEEVRSISRNLQPSALTKLGLVAAVNDLVNRFDGDHTPDIYFQHYNVPTNLDEMISLNIYRIIQELLNNTIKYAQASEVLIQLSVEESDIYIQYEDDGRGFDMENINKKGMGLENIYSRIKYLKGQVALDAKEGKGVSYLIKIPL